MNTATASVRAAAPSKAADARQRIPTLRHTRSFAVATRKSETPQLDAAE